MHLNGNWRQLRGKESESSETPTRVARKYVCGPKLHSNAPFGVAIIDFCCLGMQMGFWHARKFGLKLLMNWLCTQLFRSAPQSELDWTRTRDGNSRRYQLLIRETFKTSPDHVIIFLVNLSSHSHATTINTLDLDCLFHITKPPIIPKKKTPIVRFLFIKSLSLSIHLHIKLKPYASSQIRAEFRDVMRCSRENIFVEEKIDDVESWLPVLFRPSIATHRESSRVKIFRTLNN